MNEADILGALGFFFTGLGLVTVGFVLAGLLGAAIACILVGIGLGVISTLE